MWHLKAKTIHSSKVANFQIQVTRKYDILITFPNNNVFDSTQHAILSKRTKYFMYKAIMKD